MEERWRERVKYLIGKKRRRIELMPFRRAAHVTMVLPTTKASKSELETPSMALGSWATVKLVSFLLIQFLDELVMNDYRACSSLLPNTWSYLSI